MEKLREQLDDLISRLENAEDLHQRLKELENFYPFNEFEFIISHLLAADILSIAEYGEIRADYIGRNQYQDLYNLSSKKFGSVWAEVHLKEISPNLALSGTLDFDFLLPPENVKVEVKASRATDAKSNIAFAQKSLFFGSDKKFDMNFQQIKPRFCDVFVWIGVWRDAILYWVISSCEVENNRHFSDKQHKGNVGEGQLHIKRNNIDDFQEYLANSAELEKAIREAFGREKKLRNR